jgi:hypothetical protein
VRVMGTASAGDVEGLWRLEGAECLQDGGARREGVEIVNGDAAVGCLLELPYTNDR